MDAVATKTKKAKTSPYPDFKDFNKWAPGELGIDINTGAWFIFHSLEEIEVGGHKISLVKGRYTGRPTGTSIGTYMVANKDFSRLRPLPKDMTHTALDAFKAALSKPGRFSKHGRDIAAYAQELSALAATRAPESVAEALRKVMAYRKKQNVGYSIEYFDLYDNLTWTYAFWSEAAGYGNAKKIHDDLESFLIPLITPDEAESSALDDEDDEDAENDTPPNDTADEDASNPEPGADTQDNTPPTEVKTPQPSLTRVSTFVPPAEVWTNIPRGSNEKPNADHVAWVLKLIDHPDDVGKIYEARELLTVSQLLFYAISLVPALHRPSRSDLADAMFLHTEDAQKAERSALNIMAGIERDKERQERQEREDEIERQKAQAAAAAAAVRAQYAARAQKKLPAPRAPVDLTAPVLREEDFGWFTVITYNRKHNPHVLAKSGVKLTPPAYALLKYLHEKPGTLVPEEDVIEALFKDAKSPKFSTTKAATALNAATYDHLVAVNGERHKPLMHLPGRGMQLLRPGETWSVPPVTYKYSEEHDLNIFTLSQIESAAQKPWVLKKDDRIARLSDKGAQIILYVAKPDNRGRWHSRTHVIAGLSENPEYVKQSYAGAFQEIDEAVQTVLGDDAKSIWSSVPYKGIALAPVGGTLSDVPDFDPFVFIQKKGEGPQDEDEQCVYVSGFSHRLMTILTENPGKLFERDELLTLCYSPKPIPSSADIYMSNSLSQLRNAINAIQKQHKKPRINLIESRRGVGICYHPNGFSSASGATSFTKHVFSEEHNFGNFTLSRIEGAKQTPWLMAHCDKSVSLSEKAAKILLYIAAEDHRGQWIPRRDIMTLLETDDKSETRRFIKSIAGACETLYGPEEAAKRFGVETYAGIALAKLNEELPDIPERSATPEHHAKNLTFSQTLDFTDFTLRRIEGVKQNPWQILRGDTILPLSEKQAQVLLYVADDRRRGKWIGSRETQAALDFPMTSYVSNAAQGLAVTFETLFEGADISPRFQYIPHQGMALAKTGEDLPKKPEKATKVRSTNKDLIFSETHEFDDFTLRKIENAKRMPWQIVREDKVVFLPDAAARILLYIGANEQRGKWFNRIKTIQAVQLNNAATFGNSVKQLDDAFALLFEGTDLTPRFRYQPYVGITLAKAGEDLPAVPVRTKTAFNHASEPSFSEEHDLGILKLRRIEGAKRAPWQAVREGKISSLSDVAAKILLHIAKPENRGKWHKRDSVVTAADIKEPSYFSQSVAKLSGVFENLFGKDEGKNYFAFIPFVGITLAKEGQPLPQKPERVKKVSAPKNPRAKKRRAAVTPTVYPTLYYHPEHGLSALKNNGYKRVDVAKYVTLLQTTITRTNLALADDLFDPKAPAYTEDAILANRSPTKVIPALAAYHQRPTSNPQTQAKRIKILNSMAQDIALIFDFVDEKRARDFLVFLSGRDKKTADQFLWPFESREIFADTMDRIQAWQERMKTQALPKPAAKAAQTAAHIRNTQAAKKNNRAPQPIIEQERQYLDRNKSTQDIFNKAAKLLNAEAFVILSRQFMRASQHRVSVRVLSMELGADTGYILSATHEAYQRMYNAFNTGKKDDQEMLAVLRSWRLPSRKSPESLGIR